MPNIEMKPHKPGRKAAVFWAVSGLFLMAFALLMILVYGAKVIALPENRGGLLWLVALLGFFGAVLLTRGVLHKNDGAFWLSWLFIWCAAVVAVGSFVPAENLGFRQIWPAFLLSPAAAAAATWLFFSAKAAHLKTIIFFSALSAIFFLNSIEAINLNWWWIGGIMIFAVGAMFFINAFTTKRGRWDDADNSERKDRIKIE